MDVPSQRVVSPRVVRLFEPRVFAVLVGILLFVVVSAGTIPLDESPFTKRDSVRLSLLSVLPESDVLEIKLAHASANSRYHIGLFGNSRILMVGERDLGAPAGTAFNFGGSGISFATSVRFAERLADAGKLPDIVVVSFDHPELPHPARAIVDPSFAIRWFRYLGDVIVGARQGHIGASEVVEIVGLFFSQEIERLKVAVSFEHLRRVLVYRRPSLPFGQTMLAYRNDGSRPERIPEAPPKFERPLRTVAAPAAVERDLMRLAELARRYGSRVIVYESPLHPSLMPTPSGLTPQAGKLRQRWLDQCSRSGLTCLLAPTLGDGRRPPYWPDSNHAPATLLGAFIKAALDGAVSASGQEVRP